MKTREECIITNKGKIKKKIYCVFESGIEVPIREYKLIKRKMKRNKIRINFEDYYTIREAKRLLNE